MKDKIEIITAITPTGDRPLPFTLCQYWMKKQTLRVDQWVVVDDGKVPMEPKVGMEYIRREPQPDDPKQTLIENLRVAIPYIRGNKIIIIEDDEYYAPGYIEEMSSKLDRFEIVGIGKSKYYHLLSGYYSHLANTRHASFAEMAFRRSFLNEFKGFLTGGLYLDMRIWRGVDRKRAHLFFDDKNPLHVGMKGMPGRNGIGGGHDITHHIYQNKTKDESRNILKSWIPDEEGFNIYMAIVSGDLTEDNCNQWFKMGQNITGITVCSNTKDLIERAYTSVRKFHPEMPIIIIDGSSPKDPCADYVKSLISNLTTVISLGYNIGHGKGMCMGIEKAKTKCALIFDSDIKMLKSPVNQMLEMMEEDTFGVGYIEKKTGQDGYEYGINKSHKNQEPMPYLHPYFQLINIKNYRKFHPYVHHGAPCYLTMRDIYKRGLSKKILKEFLGLGHSAGQGFNWKGRSREYIQHDTRGTREDRGQKGLATIEGGWTIK